MEVISTRRYEAHPPNNTHPDILVDREKSIAKVKEEEWETRKKKEITTTRQIETRVKRQVILEDGEVVGDSGPLVTTNTTEDIEQQEHTTQERRTTGDEPKEVEWPTGKDGGIVQKELNETVTRSREEIEERLETEDRQQLGDISDEAYLNAVCNKRGDLRIALAELSRQVTPQIGPRVVQHTTRSNKVVDTEKTLEWSELKADGKIVTEKKKTIEHEEIKDDEIPSNNNEDNDENNDDFTETRKEASQRFVKTRDEDIVDYISNGEKVAREMRYISETIEGERLGDWPPTSTTTMNNVRLHKHDFESKGTGGSRKDALTKKPLDLEEEDEARKFETSKWLESHFGSDSRSSQDSAEFDDSTIPIKHNTSFINVTMKSCTTRDGKNRSADYNSSRNQQIRRTGTHDINSSNGYFQGISEWSERYQDNEKQNVTMAQTHHTSDLLKNHQQSMKNTTQSNYKHSHESRRHQKHHQSSQHEYDEPPSPPVRRKMREQILSKSVNKYNEPANMRVGSPVHVIQRTWENRNHDIQVNEQVSPEYNLERTERKLSARSHSTSPICRTESQTAAEKKNADENSNALRTNKSSGQSKYKIGESFRKLVGKLRSASSERRNKRNSCNSTSQVTQTDDSSTYLQYNAVDCNIPMTTDYDIKNQSPQRPPRSPKNVTTDVSKTKKIIKTVDQTDCSVPVQRYYLGENPYAGSIYGREKGYKDEKLRQQYNTKKNNSNEEYSVESNSLGRFSKSTSKLVSDYEKQEHLRSTQTLPRKLHSTKQQYHPQSNNYYTNNYKRSQPKSCTRSESEMHTTSKSLLGMKKSIPSSRQYGSMINISFKNTVTSTPRTNAVPPASNTQSHSEKSERVQKPSLSRSQSFNIEASRNGNIFARQSNSQLNRLDETPPLKSPGILASISRSNKDLFKDEKHDY